MSSTKTGSSSKCRISAYGPRIQIHEPETYYSAFEVEEARRRNQSPRSGRTSASRPLSFSSIRGDDGHDEQPTVAAAVKDEDDDDDHNVTATRQLKYADYDPNDDDDDGGGSLSDEVYIVKQNYGYCSILFSIVQTVVLAVMMIKCGTAPMQINPMYGPYPDVLSEYGAKNSYLILEQDEWWRLLSPILLHAGVIHLLCNVAVQLETGVFFEKEWGSGRWLVIYLTSGLGSSVLSTIVKPNALSVGSSGAIMGLFGAKLSEVVMRACEQVRSKQDRVGRQVRKEQCAAVTCSVIVIMCFSFIPYVDWAAHLGGLVTGIFVGASIFACQIQSMCGRAVLVLMSLAATVACLSFGFVYMYSGAVQPMAELADVCAYYQQTMGNEYECTCKR
jgi:membrane associated rhomboid family serine protease